jgi:hypothetical protein
VFFALVAKAQRRTFTAEYKLKIVQELEAVAYKRGGGQLLMAAVTELATGWARAPLAVHCLRRAHRIVAQSVRQTVLR